MKFTSIAFGAGLLAASASASALNIALTNDDGWSTPGIQALYQALTDAGHTVVLAGPLDGQSGSGTAFNFSSLEITRQAENQFSVALEGGMEGAEPATSGANLAAATYTSGTVGAALHAVGLVTGGGSVPAIAISTDDRCNEDAGVTEECLAVADFLVDYIDHLIARPAYQKGNSEDLIP